MKVFRIHRLLYILLLVVIIYLIYSYYKRKSVENFETEVPNKDENDEFRVDMMKCSPDCCAYKWPKDENPRNGHVGDGLVANSYRCSNGVKSGCPCMSKKQATFLSNRGGNIPDDPNNNYIPESYYLYPKDENLFYDKKGPNTSFLVNDAQLYSLPNHGAIYEMDATPKQKQIA